MTGFQHDGWSINALAREAIRNVFAHQSRLLFVTLVAIVAGSVLAMALAFDANSFRNRLTDLDLKGRNLVSLISADPNVTAEIDRDSCEALTDTPGVERAGFIVAAGSTEVIQLGQPTNTVFASTSLFPQLQRSQALVGSAFGQQPQRSGTITTGLGHFSATKAIAQPEGLNTNSSLILPLSPSTTSAAECFAVLTPYAQAQTVIPFLVSQLDAQGAPIVGREATKQTMDPIALFLDRPTRFLPIVIGLAGALVAGLGIRLRAAEFATYRLSGTSPRSLGILVFFEQAVVAGVGVAVGSLSLAFLAKYLISVPAAFLWIASGFLLWLTAASLMSLPLLKRDALAMAKDR